MAWRSGSHLASCGQPVPSNLAVNTPRCLDIVHVQQGVSPVLMGHLSKLASSRTLHAALDWLKGPVRENAVIFSCLLQFVPATVVARTCDWRKEKGKREREGEREKEC